MQFGTAIEAAKTGARIARRGWNGKDMWVAYSPGHDALPAEKFFAGPNRRHAEENGGTARVMPSFTMKLVCGAILPGWLASQTDMLADDWEIV